MTASLFAEIGLGAGSFLDRDHAGVADAFEGLGQQLTDLGIVVGGDRGHAGLLGASLDLAAQLVEGGAGGGDGLVDTGAQGDRVDARREVLQALAEDGFGQDRGGRGTVAGDVVGLVGDLVHELGAHVLEGVGQVDLLGDRDAVLRDGGATEGLLEDDVATGGAEGHLDGLRELRDAHAHLLARGVVEHNLLGHGSCSSLFCGVCLWGIRWGGGSGLEAHAGHSSAHATHTAHATHSVHAVHLAHALVGTAGGLGLGDDQCVGGEE